MTLSIPDIALAKTPVAPPLVRRPAAPKASDTSPVAISTRHQQQAAAAAAVQQQQLQQRGAGGAPQPPLGSGVNKPRIIIKKSLGMTASASAGVNKGSAADGSKRVRLVLQQHRQSGRDSAVDSAGDSDGSAGGRLQGQGRGKGMAMLQQQRPKLAGASRQVGRLARNRNRRAEGGIQSHFVYPSCVCCREVCPAFSYAFHSPTPFCLIVSPPPLLLASSLAFLVVGSVLRTRDHQADHPAALPPSRPALCPSPVRPLQPLPPPVLR